MKLAFVYTLILFSKSVIGQTDDEDIKEANRLLQCQQNWKYSVLKNKIEGKVLFYMQPITPCGGISSASNAVIATNGGDTIRILQLCDNIQEDSFLNYIQKGTPLKLRINVNDYVIISPMGTIDWRAGEVPNDPFSCAIKETFFGDIIKKE